MVRHCLAILLWAQGHVEHKVRNGKPPVLGVHLTNYCRPAGNSSGHRMTCQLY